MTIGFGIDPDQGLSAAEEIRLVKLAAELGYESAWTPSRADELAFERCIRWYEASGLPVGISAVPASGRSPDFYAKHARNAWEATTGKFTLVVGSGRMPHPAAAMSHYIEDLRERLAPDQPLYVAALGPLMIRVGARLADGVALNWCTDAQVSRSRNQLAEAAAAAGRPTPKLVAYIRAAVDPDSELARDVVGRAALGYARASAAYRAHFERIGFRDELIRIEAGGENASPGALSEVGAGGNAPEARERFMRLAEGLDIAIVRVLVAAPDAFASAQRAVEACAPHPRLGRRVSSSSAS